MLSAITWVTRATGQWQLTQVITENNLSQLGSWEKTCINLLLIMGVVIPAAQWPFHRWLLNSVVTPTPISAVMHAGIVNAGGILLTRFSPLFSGDIAQVFLLLLSSISVLIGTGMMLVQVDYKRQLVGSTIAQMGFMLIQCALGAYLAAIIHAVLHGLFKATLFLQAGSAVHHEESITPKPQLKGWSITGSVLGLLIGIGYLLLSPGEGYQWISAIIMGWSVSFGWTRLVVSGHGRLGSLAGFVLFTVITSVYIFFHSAFDRLLHGSIQTVHTSAPVTILFLIILLTASLVSLLLVRYRSSTAFAVIYLWLVRLGEPQKDLIESHPKYLTQSLSQGGHIR